MAFYFSNLILQTAFLLEQQELIEFLVRFRWEKQVFKAFQLS
ncbi:hypothetical protein [Limosilactobacillus reuteri]|nr:hypothetical protein [Limosilactobacillus reuteri]